MHVRHHTYLPTYLLVSQLTHYPSIHPFIQISNTHPHHIINPRFSFIFHLSKISKYHNTAYPNHHTPYSTPQNTPTHLNTNPRIHTNQHQHQQKYEVST
ncbi:hypothetical protein SS1G_02156 [Sclerotinia sclerotiorum 1980 UF-70]|uniref:Uncharacterized protein n=1 Tax=Sclerotinia sclerotiorum (strain ATCC 18683 / 1980 / Ss-1) TaxID=665079 RepID=A7EA26_SCLS1|nr:hypothetical protein SS1G_02156 [Sclerotinia sclerotiorum 1980 UF-70]EDN99304.1 hypothetical protein SS1G_02156 [Sclerotinia sclerotiorum 1980 UF-70]